MEAVEPVCTADGAWEVAVLDGVEALVAKSLLLRQPGGGDEPRFMMLETIRDYALEQLAESGEADTVRSRHTAFYLALVERAEPHLRGAQRTHWLQRLDLDQANFRAALAWITERGAIEMGLRLAGGLALFWRERGYWSEGARWLTTVLAMRAPAPLAAVETGGNHARQSAVLAEARTLYAAGLLAWYQAQYEETISWTEEGLRLFRVAGDKRGMARSLELLGLTARARRDFQRAEALLRESLTLSQSIGDEQGIASALSNLGRIAWRQGDYDQASQFFHMSLSLYLKLSDTGGVALSHYRLGMVAYWRGTLEEAEREFGEALVTYSNLEDKHGTASALNGLGNVSGARRDFESAQRLLEKSLTLYQELVP